MKKLRFYIAGHFFNRGGYLLLEELAQELTRILGDTVDFYIPHRNDSINDKAGNDDIITGVSIYEADAEEIMKCDGIIACLDGVEIDTGVGGEVFGMAVLNEQREKTIQALLNNTDLSHEEIHSIVGDEKIIIGYTTDMRRNKADEEFIDNLCELDTDKAIEKLEQHKHNHLYRNLMITGACDKYGKLITGYATNTNHAIEIADYIKSILLGRTLVQEFNSELDKISDTMLNTLKGEDEHEG